MLSSHNSFCKLREVSSSPDKEQETTFDTDDTIGAFLVPNIQAQYSSEEPLLMTKENNTLRLLVVEDNPGDYLLLKKYLHRTSIVVEIIHWAKNLSEAKRFIAQNEIDAAFLDLSLPDSSGVQSFISLNKVIPHVPIIVLSGLLDMQVALETISLGAQDFLMKGEFDEKLLAKSVQYSLERKKTLEKLKESNERFEYVTQATFDAVWDCKLDTKELYWANNFYTLFGHTPGNEKDNYHRWEQLLHPDDRERILASISALINGTYSNWVHEYRFKKMDGTYAVILDKSILLRDKAGKAYRMIGAMQDITRQKEEEQTLKLFESVIVNANDGVLISEAEPLEFPGPRIIYVNEAMTRMTGYSKEEWIGSYPGMWYGSDSDPLELERLFKAMMNWEATELEMAIYKKNGEKIWINCSVVPISDGQGRFTHWISLVRDVTERRNHTKEIENQNEKLRDIAWMQSHVVRAPLARIMGLINVLDYEPNGVITRGEVLGHIVNSANELDDIIREIVRKSSELKIHSSS